MKQMVVLEAHDVVTLRQGGEIHLSVGGTDVVLVMEYVSKNGGRPSTSEKHGPKVSPGARREEIVKAMEALGGEKLKPFKIAQFLNRPRVDVQGDINRTLRAGLIKKNGRGHYSLLTKREK